MEQSLKKNDSHVSIREAEEGDFQFVTDLMVSALGPYYGGDHQAHAKRILDTHLSGGKDKIGHFSFEQRMFIATVDGTPSGIIHIVGKRQGTYKISPIIVVPDLRSRTGLGSALLDFAENYARAKGARQMYCTVAEQNREAVQFFIKKGYIIAGRSESHYKLGITEVMFYKPFVNLEFEERFDRPHISVVPLEKGNEVEVRELLLRKLPPYFGGIDDTWVDSLFDGYRRRKLLDVNTKYKLIYVAIDRSHNVLGVAGATPKKGEPIKVMPLVSQDLPAFVALITDIPYLLKPFGHKLYIHMIPSAEETIALQQRGWKLDAALPAAYRDDQVTQQWSLDIGADDYMRVMRVKERYLDLIKQGKKTLEVRVGYNFVRNIKVGERIRLESRVKEQVVRVNDVRKYSSIDEMMIAEDPERIIPGMMKEEVSSLLRQIYPPDREKLGIIVLDISVQP
jgi:ASC-1-like (ASCH) protein/GNAT superfamily N-acetyltransferase